MLPLRWWLLLLLTIFCVGHAATAADATPNFTSAEPVYLAAAEAGRIRSATFWTGNALPQPWFAPCPIEVRITPSSGGGKTSFQFENGEVFGWRMIVTGQRAAILQDVLPHEVDHMVRATLVRKPIARWLDEGCAALFESPASHALLREIASRADTNIISETWLCAKQYPPHDLQQLYAVGYSLVEFLLQQQGPHTLLELQRSESVIDGLQACYQLSVGELRSKWADFVQSQTSHFCDEHCVVHRETQRHPLCNCGQSPNNLLVVWTASWCGPCHRFWRDAANNPDLQRRLAEYHIHIYDFDAHRNIAERHGIHSVPTFQWRGGHHVGYSGAHEFLQKLPSRIGLQSASVPLKQTTLPQSEIPETTPLPVESQSKTSGPLTGDATSSASMETPVSDHPAITSQDAAGGGPSKAQRRRWLEWLPAGLTVLQWTGILGGTFATGGAGGIAVSAVFWILRRRLRSPQQRLEQSFKNELEKANQGPAATSSSSETARERRGPDGAIPFPRHLDEARELLELRESEGRVVALDALRGMFLDDELEKFAAMESPEVTRFVQQLRDAIDDRVNNVAPIATKLN